MWGEMGVADAVGSLLRLTVLCGGRKGGGSRESDHVHGLELGLEPAKDDVDGDAAVRVVVDGGDLLGGYGGIPGTWEEGGDDFEPSGGVQ